jgi:hypothetical protein
MSRFQELCSTGGRTDRVWWTRMNPKFHARLTRGSSCATTLRIERIDGGCAKSYSANYSDFIEKARKEEIMKTCMRRNTSVKCDNKMDVDHARKRLESKGGMKRRNPFGMKRRKEGSTLGLMTRLVTVSRQRRRLPLQRFPKASQCVNFPCQDSNSCAQ